LHGYLFLFDRGMLGGLRFAACLVERGLIALSPFRMILEQENRGRSGSLSQLNKY
jgi:hypothetical protein